MSTYKSKLHQMSMEYPTEYWNDSCSEEELKYAISHGAVGATSNPTIVHAVLKKEFHLWRDRIHTLLLENPAWSETELTWKLFEEMAVYGAGFLLPTFESHQGKRAGSPSRRTQRCTAMLPPLRNKPCISTAWRPI